MLSFNNSQILPFSRQILSARFSFKQKTSATFSFLKNTFCAAQDICVFGYTTPQYKPSSILTTWFSKFIFYFFSSYSKLIFSFLFLKSASNNFVADSKRSFITFWANLYPQKKPKIKPGRATIKSLIVAKCSKKSAIATPFLNNYSKKERK